MTTLVTTREVTDKSSFRILGVLLAEGVPAVQANVSEITWELFNSVSGASLDTGSLVVADVVYDTMQHGPIWKTNEGGYNFRWDVDETLLVDGLTQYRLEIRFTMTGGAIVYSLLQIPVTPALTEPA